MDRLGDSAKKGLDFIKNRALETVEVQKLSATLKKLEERRQNCLLELGHLVLAAYGTEDLKDETFAARVDELHHLSQEMERVKHEHEETKEQLVQSVEEILPRRPGSSRIPEPKYDSL